MLIELLSPSNHVTFNIKLAQILGLKAAVYISQLLDINEKAMRKGKVEDGFFTIDRKYVESRSTLTRDEQMSIEKDLVNIGIIVRNEEKRNSVCLKLDSLTSIMMSPDEDLLRDISNLSKTKKKPTKSEIIKEALKDNIITTNIELRDAYCEWIDSVIEKKGIMTKAAVTYGQNDLDKFTNRDLDMALAILKIASIHGYDDLTWAMNTYNKDKKSTTSYVPFLQQQACNATVNTAVRCAPRVSDEVF